MKRFFIIAALLATGEIILMTHMWRGRKNADKS